MERPALEALANEWLVYGDSLQEAGDPRGELVGLSHGVDEGRTAEQLRDAYVREHGAALLGVAKNFLDAYRFEWRFCEVVAAEVHVKPGDDGEAIVRALLDAPVTANLSQIALVAHPERGTSVDLAPAMAVLEADERIKGLALVDDRARRSKMLVSRDFDPDANLVTLGSLAGFWPRLERLRLVVADAQQLELPGIDAPELRNFVLHNLRYGDGWGGGAGPLTDHLALAKWPKLAELEVRLCETWIANIPEEDEPYVRVYSEPDDEDDDGRYAEEAEEGEIDSVDWSQLSGLFGNLKQCPLRRLALTNFVGSGSLIDTLGQAGVAPTLVELDLSHSALSDDDVVERMFAHLPTFSTIKRMVLDGTHVTDEAMTRLRGLGIEVVKDGSPAGAKYRFVVGQE